MLSAVFSAGFYKGIDRGKEILVNFVEVSGILRERGFLEISS